MLTVERVQAAFEASYRARFSRLLPGAPVKIVSLRATAIGRRPHFDLTALAPDARASLDSAQRPARPVWFSGRWVETAVWSRLDLPVGAIVAGPAILEQPDATIVVEPGQSAKVDRLGDLVNLAGRRHEPRGAADRRSAKRLPASARRLCQGRSGQRRHRRAARAARPARASDARGWRLGGLDAFHARARDAAANR